MLGTGFRISEVLGLRWEDVNFQVDPVEVTVAGAVKQRKATPDSPSLVWEPRTKTRAGRRTVSVPTFAADVLHRLNIEKAPDAVFVFATSKATPRSPANVRTRLRRVCGSTFEGLTPHTLRRTVLTIVAEHTDVLTASRLAGHASTKITEEKYIRFGPKAPDASWALESLSAGENS
ncbi:tyrosine-type recombinase/integrase [Corynebacterium hadale]